MLKTGVVRLSGRGTNVEFALDDAAPFDRVVRELRDYLAQNRALCSGGAVAVNLGRRMLRPEELGQIKQILEKESGLTVARFWCDPDVLEAALSQNVPVVSALSESSAARSAPPGRAGFQVTVVPAMQLLHQRAAFEPTRARGSREPRQADAGRSHRTEALVIKTTCRSGKTVHYPGDVIVRGDVNPGAEIIADGDILVFGSLRGQVHAGAAGDARAAIVALKLAAPWLQIAHYTWTAPGANHWPKSTTGPKMAYVRRRSIHVVPFGGHGRGTFYDR